jgi:hypothetical protein
VTQTTEHYATATSSGLERDARHHNADATNDPGQIALGVIIGRTLNSSTSSFIASHRYWSSRNCCFPVKPH